VHYVVSENGDSKAYSSYAELPPEVKRALAQALGSGASEHVADATSLSAAARNPQTRAALEQAYEAIGAALARSSGEGEGSGAEGVRSVVSSQRK
jgi:hypothetical protein